jgi:hypothetical protein
VPACQTASMHVAITRHRFCRAQLTSRVAKRAPSQSNAYLSRFLGYSILYIYFLIYYTSIHPIGPGLKGPIWAK